MYLCKEQSPYEKEEPKTQRHQPCTTLINLDPQGWRTGVMMWSQGRNNQIQL